MTLSVDFSLSLPNIACLTRSTSYLPWYSAAQILTLHGGIVACSIGSYILSQYVILRHCSRSYAEVAFEAGVPLTGA